MMDSISRTMKFCSMLVLFLAVSFGCASKHSVTQTSDSLLFSLHRPKATQVQFASSVDNFALHDTAKNKKGDWLVRVQPVKALSYFYVVDGSVYLPDCRFKETDDFGSENCLYQPQTVTLGQLSRYTDEYKIQTVHKLRR